MISVAGSTSGSNYVILALGFLAETIAASTPLAEYATSLAGMMTSDLPRFVRYFWELRDLGEDGYSS